MCLMKGVGRRRTSRMTMGNGNNPCQHYIKSASEAEGNRRNNINQNSVGLLGVKARFWNQTFQSKGLWGFTAMVQGRKVGALLLVASAFSLSLAFLLISSYCYHLTISLPSFFLPSSHPPTTINVAPFLLSSISASHLVTECVVPHE